MARSGNKAGAEQAYRDLLRTSRSNADAIAGLAQLLLERGEHDEAEALLERAPADRRVKVLRHRLFLERFASKHAGEDLEREALSAPSDPRVRYRWGVLLAAQGDYTRALDELLESVRLERNFADEAAVRRRSRSSTSSGWNLPSPVITSGDCPRSCSEFDAGGSFEAGRQAWWSLHLAAERIAPKRGPGENQQHITEQLK